jgi:hypothetical protein
MQRYIILCLIVHATPLAGVDYVSLVEGIQLKAFKAGF